MNRFPFLIPLLLLALTASAQTPRSASPMQHPTGTRLHPEHIMQPLRTDAIGTLSAAQAPLRLGTRVSAALPSTGQPQVPVVLVQFADTLFKVADTADGVKSFYQDFLNAPEGQAVGTSYRSVGEYFRLQSDGQFTPRFTIIGPITLSRSYTYYGADRNGRKDANIGEFYSEACKSAIATGTQWSDFDNNGDGTIDMVYFIYAGEGQNASSDSNTIWPKESARSLTVQTDGQELTFGAYGCSNECFRYQPDGIGPIVHELAHGLGLPDFYDTAGSSFGLGYWDLMDEGCYQLDGLMPVGFSAYERDFMGWRPLVELSPDTVCTLTLQPLETGGTAYKLTNPERTGGTEYYILENRQSIDFDLYLGWPTSRFYQDLGPNRGLMVTHVDYNASAWQSNSVNTDPDHQRIALVPADGHQVSYADRTGTAKEWGSDMQADLYPWGDVDELSSYRVFTQGGLLRQTVSNIRQNADGSITLDINAKEPDVPELR